jgi:uncharacterized protein YndB with AHSA1/START domain
MPKDTIPQNDRELVLDRLLDAPVEKVWRCWTEPELLKQWFAPKPFTTVTAEMDLRPGGATDLTMRAPDGTEMPNPGVVLEAVPNRKLVFTDAFGAGWRPKEGAPFMVAEINFADEGGKTRYVARALHWTQEAAEQHSQMGFHEGWGICADQLEALAKTL